MIDYDRVHKKVFHFGRGDDRPRKLSRNFWATEFQCKCGECYLQYFDEALFKGLETLRTRIGNQPITINSGYRCKQHNDRVGGSKKSQHMEGRAADIAIPSKYTPIEFGTIADLCGFTGIGIYPTWVHVDVRPTLVVKRWGMWS